MELNLDTAPGYFFSFTDEGKLLHLNTSLCDDLGYSKEELSGKKIDYIFTKPTSIFYQTHFFPLLKFYGHAEEIFISLLTRQKDSVPVLMNAKREQSNGEAINTCVCIKVPNRKKFEDELIAAKREVEKATRENIELIQVKTELENRSHDLERSLHLLGVQHAELKQLNRIITHDLQEPLRKLSMFSNMLLYEQTGNSDSKIVNHVSKLLNASEQMRLTISGLQQFIWLNETPPVFSEINLNELLPVVAKELEKEFDPANWELRTKELTNVHGDWDQLSLLFYHTISNSIKFRKPGERVVISIRGTVLQKNRYRQLQKYKYEDYLKLQLLDNGTGFDPVYKEQVFGLFQKLHSGSGKGLGLALAKKVVENHFGLIDLDSKPGEGTTITILLPIFS